MCIFWTKRYTCGCVSHIFRDRCPDYLRSGCERCPHETADAAVEQRRSYFPCYPCLVKEDREEKRAAAAAGISVEGWWRRREVRRKMEEERAARRKEEERRREREMEREGEGNGGDLKMGGGVVEEAKAVMGRDGDDGSGKAEREKKKAEEEEVWTDVAGSKKWRRGRGAKMIESQPSASLVVAPSPPSHVVVVAPSHAIKPPSVEKPSSPSTKPSPTPSPTTMTKSGPSLERPGKPTSIAMPPPPTDFDFEKKLGRAMAKEFGMPLPSPWKTPPLAEDPPVVLPSYDSYASAKKSGPSLERPGKPTSIAIPPPPPDLDFRPQLRAMAKEFNLPLPSNLKTTPLVEDPPVVLPSYDSYASAKKSGPSLERPGKPTSIAIPTPPPDLDFRPQLRAMAKEFDLPLPSNLKTTPLEDSSRAVAHPSPPVVVPSSPACFHPDKSPGSFFGPPASRKSGAARGPSGGARDGPGQQGASSTAEKRRDGAHHQKKPSLEVAQQRESVVMPDLSFFPGEDITIPHDKSKGKEKTKAKKESDFNKPASSRDNASSTSKATGKNNASVKDKVSTSPKEKKDSGIDPGGRAGRWGPSRNDKVTILQRDRASGRKKEGRGPPK